MQLNLIDKKKPSSYARNQNGDEKIKEVSLILIVTGEKEVRDNTIRELKRLADPYQQN